MSESSVDDADTQERDATPQPGLLQVWSKGGPAHRALPCAPELFLGRDGERGAVALGDRRVSRRHCRVKFDGAAWLVDDLGSSNGTFVDGNRVSTKLFTRPPRVLRLGHCLLVPVADLAKVAGRVETQDDAVAGPRLRRLLARARDFAAVSDTLLIRGEAGVGKRRIARAFHHRAAGPGRPFVEVDCANLPEGTAERLLFGARVGGPEFGYMLAADGGTLLLSEPGALDDRVQRRLLRALETRAVLAVGGARPRPVDLRLCVTTRHDPRQQLRERRLRQDLYVRVGRPELEVPPLRERVEEIPCLIQRALRLARPGTGAHASLVERCLLRHWPGNTRELLAELEDARRHARRDGRDEVRGDDLDELAGRRPESREPASPRRRASTLRRAAVENALVEAGGELSRAAKLLGVHRSQLRRWLARKGMDPVAYARSNERQTS